MVSDLCDRIRGQVSYSGERVLINLNPYFSLEFLNNQEVVPKS